MPGRHRPLHCRQFRVCHAISALTTGFGSECVRVPVYMSELELHRVTRRWIRTRVRALMSAYVHSQTHMCVCVCIHGYLSVYVYVRVCVCVCSCVFSLCALPRDWGYCTSLLFKELLFRFWFSAVWACVCIRVCSGVVSTPRMGKQSQSTFQRSSLLILVLA